MTNETRERIRAYKKLLPDMRERVLGVALLLLTSVAMMVTASFAWITLSRAPEVTGMQTTVAANGNLEIALAQGLVAQKDAEGNRIVTPPGESAVGDSSAAEGQTIVGANTTWGNLVNVSDPSYGLSNIALRPALLSQYNRADYPLNGASYGDDGRVVTTNERYLFANYVKIDDRNSYFAATQEAVHYGVRAIASVRYENVQGNARIDAFREETNKLFLEAQNFYGKIVDDETNEVNTLNAAKGVTCITALEGIVTIFAQDKVNQMMADKGLGSAKPRSSCSKYIWYLYQMMLLLDEDLEKEGKALLEMANWQAYIASGDKKVEKTFATVEQLTSASATQLATAGVRIDALAGYKDSVTKLNGCIAGLKPMADKCKNPDAPEEDYTWDDIADYVNVMVNVNTATIDGISLNSIGFNAAMDLLGKSSVKVEAKSGVLVDIEKRLVNDDNRVQANVKVTVSAIVTKTMKGTVYTVAYGAGDPTYTKDLAYADGLESGAKGEAIANDTYGMALDVWVRTNYPSTVLTLEGSVKYEDKRDTKTIDGVEYELFTIMVGAEDAQEEKTVYQKNDKWYYADTTGEVASEDMGSQTPQEKYIPIVVGYEGENRIWEDWRELLEGGFIVQDATTQGAGSCFVFYASTPTEQAKTMELLESFSVAFMDQDGNLLGTAKLNLENAYANQGKVTVPLEMETGVTYTNEEGKEYTGITRLKQNTPQLITAVVYLNGQKLQNANVLANGEIQGQLNIQFGTDSVLIAPDNEELMNEARSITAEVTVNGTTISNGTIGGTEGLEYKAEGYDAVVKLTVEGEQPERISGFFIRIINSTQGTRGETLDFVKQTVGDEIVWVATFKLTNPGTYAFNTLIVDGVQYTLHDGSELAGVNTYYPANRPYVYIKGLAVSSVSVGVTAGTHMTADSSINFPVDVVIDAAVAPKQVNAQFFSTDNKKQYTAILSYDNINKKWTGSANIASSDTYVLKYISVDGEIIDSPSTDTYTLYLGLTASVSTAIPASAWTYMYEENETVQITMYADIRDDGHHQIPGLTGVMLYYDNILSPAAMTWTGTRYEGTFEATEPGRMTFKRLVLGSVGEITSASDAPVFTALDTGAVGYEEVANGGNGKIKTLIGSTVPADITLQMSHARTAKVWAKMENITEGKEETVYILGTNNGVDQNMFTFQVPIKDGEWTITQVYAQNCFGSNGKWYDDTGAEPTENDSATIAMSAEDQELMAWDVVATYTTAVYVDENGNNTFEESEKQTVNKTYNLTGTKENPTGILFNGYAPMKIGVIIMDYAGRSVAGVTNTDSNESNKWVISYDESTDTEYGGYEGASLAAIEAKFSLAQNVMIGSNAYDAMLVTENVAIGNQELSLVHSGVYTVELQIKIGTQPETLGVTPKFTIATKRPYVKFTATNPAAGSEFDVATKKDNPQKSDVQKRANTISSDYYSVTCYYKAKNDGCDCTGYDPSKVTVGLYDAGRNYDQVSCTIVSRSTASDVVFVFNSANIDANGNVFNEQTFGASGENRKYLGTNAEATELVVKVGEQSYTIPLLNPLKATLEY